MFLPRFSPRLAPQKNRNNRVFAFAPKHPTGPWTTFNALGQGAVTLPFVEKLYLWGKRITKFPNKTMRFWVNVQVARVLTKKPTNLRMGKGKGGRVGSVGVISPGSTLLAISYLRPGLIGKVTRQISVRVPFKVGVFRPNNFLSYKGQTTERTQRRYTAYSTFDLRYFFRKTNQTHSYAFMQGLTTWSRRPPRLTRLPLLADVYPYDEHSYCGPLRTLFSYSAVKFLWAGAYLTPPFVVPLSPLMLSLEAKALTLTDAALPHNSKLFDATREGWTYEENYKLLAFLHYKPLKFFFDPNLARTLWALLLMAAYFNETSHRLIFCLKMLAFRPPLCRLLLKKTPKLFPQKAPLSWMLAGFGALLNLNAHAATLNKYLGGFAVFGALRVAAVSPNAKQLTVLNTRQLWESWSAFCLTIAQLRQHKVCLLPLTEPSLSGAARAVAWSSWTGPQLVWRVVAASVLSLPVKMFLPQAPLCVIWLTRPANKTHPSWLTFPSLGVSTVNEVPFSWTSLSVVRGSQVLKLFLLSWVWKAGAL